MGNYASENILKANSSYPPYTLGIQSATSADNPDRSFYAKAPDISTISGTRLF